VKAQASAVAESGPAYLRIAEGLRGLVAAAQENEERLPTEAELCEQHRVSRQTVRRAYHELVSEGLVERTRGRGTFATNSKYARRLGTIDDLMALSADSELEIVRPLRLAAGSARARAELDAAQVMEVWARRLSVGQPFAVTILSFPVAIGVRLQRTPFARTGARIRSTALEVLERRLGESLRDAVEEVTVANVDDDVARWLEMTPGDASLRIDRVYRNMDGVPVESTINYFNPDRYTYRLRLGRAPSGVRW
jgi:GntR family transcriptional regulator